MHLLNSSYDMSGCILNCTNHGVCWFDWVNNKYKCVCNKYFSGSSCQFDTRSCFSNPCLNNASCVDVFSNLTSNNSTLLFSTYRCECQTGYQGINCQNKIDICANETCSNNGYCHEVKNLPKCKCFSMYEGEKCNIQSNELKTIKYVITTSSIVAIFVIIVFYFLILLMDLFNYLTKRPKRRRRIFRFVYIN
jgi:hypothetical protein